MYNLFTGSYPCVIYPISLLFTTEDEHQLPMTGSSGYKKGLNGLCDLLAASFSAEHIFNSIVLQGLLTRLSPLVEQERQPFLLLSQ